jgi:hypothetical protein
VLLKEGSEERADIWRGLQKLMESLAWSYRAAVPAFWRLRQEDHKFKASLEHREFQASIDNMS